MNRVDSIHLMSRMGIFSQKETEKKDMTQDMKKDTILHTGMGTYVLEQAKQIVRQGRTMSPLRAHWEFACDGLRTMLMLLILTLGIGTAWGQTDYSGTYYIGSVGYDINNPNNTDNYYLCPTKGWCSYKATNEVEAGNNQPFLTTYKCKTSAYTDGADNAVWIIEKAPNSDYYYIKHKKDSKYMVSNGKINGAGEDRMRVHLESIADLAAQDDKVLFDISPYSTYLVIRPMGITDDSEINNDHTTTDNTTHSQHRWFTVNGGNVNDLKGANGKTGGPSGYPNTKGIIGIYTQGDVNAKFYLEDIITRPTIIYNTSNQIEITAPAGSTLIYTVDDSKPTASNGTVVSSNTTSFDLPSTASATTIKAVAVVGGELSNVATYTTPVLCGTNYTYLIQSQNNAWNTTDFHFYMIPGDEASNILKVNTTSLFRPSMEWYFLSAGVENGVQYYYIVNNANSKYLCYDGTNKVYMADYTNDNKFKFKIVESPTTGTYNIYPYGQNILINKDTDNASNNVLNTASYSVDNTNSGNTRWKFVLPTSLDKTAPFTVCSPSTGSYTYYQLRSSGDEYYIKAPVSADANATMVTTSADENTYWYLEEAAAATNADWQTYYYIRNAKTGDYLYYANDNPSNDAAAFKASTTNGDADRYQFAWAHSTTADYYFIVPKMLLNQTQNDFSTMNRNSGTLRVQKVRATGSSAWLFSQVPSFQCAQPVITWSAGDGGYVVTSTESDAKIYYSTTLGEGELTPSNGTLYTGAISVADLGVESVTIRAIAARNSDGSDASTEACVTVNRVATPEKGTTNDGKVELTCTTPGAIIYFNIGDDASVADPEISPTYLYEGPIDNASGKYIKAIAVKEGWINSVVYQSGSITLQCANPVIKRGTAQHFEISCGFPAGVEIYYTTNSSITDEAFIANPKTVGTKYENEVAFTGDEVTVRAIAMADGYDNSVMVTNTITKGLEGEGTLASPYLIYDDYGFGQFIEKANTTGGTSEHFKLMADVSAGAEITEPFSGTLEAAADADGNLYKISDLTHALFNTINGGTVKNVILDNVVISSGTNVGAICNEAEGATRIYNCGILSGSIGGSKKVGGLVGLLDGEARVINCFSYANITSGEDKGGIVGYNNVASTQSSLTTMVMNCMFYGNIAEGNNISPIYGGTEINNGANGLNNYNYYRYRSHYSKEKKITKYNRALAMEEKFITRFERYRLLLNSNKKLAAKYASIITSDPATTITVNPGDMAKWVLETADRSISDRDPYSYPILKAQKYYPSIINYDAKNAPDSTTVGRNHGGKLGRTLSVTIATSKSDGGQSWPTGASITTTGLTLQRTDKDFDRFNYSYDKVQLPYYNDIGKGNYTGSRVVTGWKITSITGGTEGTYTESDSWGGYNFADRHCTNKDLYTTSTRVFSQGAYWDVPDNVTAITIEPYWAIANYVSDETYDVVYERNYALQTFTPFGTQYSNGSDIDIHGDGNTQKVYKSIANAIAGFDNSSKTVYDQAVVLVGNLHQYAYPTTDDKPYTVMSIDMNHDNEPDYSFICSHDNRQPISPIRFDFLNIMGIAEAQLPKLSANTDLFRNVSIFNLKGWFEITNTCVVNFSQFEYDNSNGANNAAVKSPAPLILLGGTYEQFVSTQKATLDFNTKKTKYIHVGGNAWFAKFGNGTHSDGNKFTPHVPISVTGGDYDEFYLSGTYQPNITNMQSDNAECYVSGGRFGDMAGASLEAIHGDVRWQIDYADITNFYGGGVNGNNPITGDIRVDMVRSHVGQYCGGPKFGDMSSNKIVTTNAKDCEFGTFFGAGYGGNSYNRVKYWDVKDKKPSDYQSYYKNDRGKYYDGGTTNANNDHADYGQKGKGVATDFDSEFFIWSTGVTGARFYVQFVSFSLARTNNVTSNLTRCTINENFYGGGSLGKVNGTANSTLDGCTVKGNVFGGGYSATLPKIGVRNTPAFVAGKEPSKNINIGMFEEGEKAGVVDYEWKHVDSESMPADGGAGTESTSGKNYVYTDEDLTTLGQVGTVNLTITNNTTVGESIYGGGEESAVEGNTNVVFNSGIVGSEGQGGAQYGNVYGGGKGKYKEKKIVNEVETEVELAADQAVKLGLVKGNTNVTINDGTIYHNVYGGGAYGSVGEFDYDTTTGLPTGRKTNTTGGVANVTIVGGSIGVDGDENGMVFGSSRGDVGARGEIHDKLAWVYDTHVVIGTSGQGTTLWTPLIKGSVYGSGENGHTFNDTEVIIHSGTIGIASGSKITTNDNGTPDDPSDDTAYEGAAYPYRGNVYGGGCGTDTYTEGGVKKYNPLAGIVQGNTTVNIDGGLVVHNVYGAGAMGSVGTTDNTGAFTSGTGTTTIAISGGTIGVDGNGNGNVFGAARGDAATTQTDVALVKTTSVTISQAEGKTTKIFGNVYGGGECGDVGTYTTNTDDANIYSEGSGVCNVTISGGTVGDESNGHGNVFGAGKGDAGTFKCMKAMVHSTNVNISKGTVYGNVYGGGEIGRVEENTTVTIGATSGTDEFNIKGDVFGAGKGLDTHGYSALVRGNPVVTVQGSAKVGGSVYGGGEIASVGKHSLVTKDNASQHPELEEGMPFTLANTDVGVCTVTVKDKAEITGNVFGAGKGVKPTEITNPGRMKPDNTMESYDPSSNAFHIYVQTLALVTETHVTIGGSATGTATKVKGSVYGGSESGFVQYHTNVDIQDNCEVGTSSVKGNVYGGGLGISGNDVAGRVGGNTNLDINGGTTHGSVFGGGAYGIVKGGVNVNINDGIIDEDVYGGGALAHTNTAMWDDTHSQLLDYAEVKNLIVGSSPVTGYYNESHQLITTENATAEDGKTYYAVYKTNVNLLGGQLRDAYGGGLGIHDVGEEGNEGFVAGTPAYVYGDVTVELNKGITSTPGCIVERIFGSNNLKGSPKGHVKVHVYATQHKNQDNVAAKYTKYENITNYTNSQYDTYLRELATTYEVPLPSGYAATIARTEYASLPGENDTEKQQNLQKLKDQAFEELRDEISKKKYDVLAVYGGGNLAPYEPAGGTETTESTEVIIDGCELTSIKQVYGGGNAAPAPATNVTVNGTHEIDEVFGGGNGKDNYVLNGEYYVNPGANVGYYNYTHLDGSGIGTQTYPFGCEDNNNASTKDGRAAYIYGTGVANTEIYGGRIHYVYGASNEKGNISGRAKSRYEEDEALNCSMIVDQTYGGGKNSIIDGTIDLDLGCTQNMAEIFGGSKNADVNSDIVLNITNGTYEKVFGGNNTSGNVNGSITVNIKEEGCSPIIIKELYLGGYLAPYSVYGYNTDGSVKTSGNKLYKDPRINVISASRIDNIYGGGYQATVVGNPHVNINMEEGVMQAKYVKTGFLDEHKDADGNLLWQGKEIVKDDDNKVVKGILNIGTIGNIYGGGNMAEIVGNTYVEIGNGFWLKEKTDDVWETKDAAGVNYTYDATDKVWKYLVTTGEGEQQTTELTAATTVPTPVRYKAKITGDVFGGGDNAAVQGNTHVNVCAVNNDDPATTDDIEMIGVTLPSTINDDVTIGGSVYGGGSKGAVGNYTYDSTAREYNFTTGTGISHVTIAGGTIGPDNNTDTEKGNVFGGGMGEKIDSGDGAFMCESAMLDGTNVVISNGTVNGTVYGGGKIGRVNHDTKVTVGLKRANDTDPAISTPVVESSVYGAGKGLSTHGYAALVRGNSYVIVQGDAKVKDCVYGGGEIASVGKYTLDDAGMPQSLANQNSGYCTVIVQDNAEIGPDVAMRMKTESGYPDDAGHVFGAGKGILPYEGYDLTDSEDIPWRVKGNDDQQWFGSEVYVADTNQDPDYKKAYLRYIETLGLATQTYVTIAGNALVKGSVYGGSMNGHVQHNTQVTIAGGQIGCQKDKTDRLNAAVWEIDPSSVTEDYECASWDFTGDHHPYDIYDYVDPTAEKPVPKPATDGHTFFGNVFGGGSGYYPYRQDPDYETKDPTSNKSRKDLGYADGLWHREAGSVGGSTVVNITGGHILTSVYGGNEQTDVGTYVKDSNYENTTTVVSGGKCTINISGGTVGVPRTEVQAKNHPVTCYVFGAGKGDQRINFNKWTNVASTQVNISGSARIYGSTFGGGEDGHVVGNVETNIGGAFNMKINNVVTPVSYSNVIIGTTGTSGVDGNIFGGGRGFSETALTAGVVGGDVAVNIHNGTILGTVFGGGRLASVGTHFADAESADYGTMQNTITPAIYYTTEEIEAAVEGDDAYGKTTTDIKTPESIHGQITVTIDGGTIGATDSNGKLAASEFSIGDVFGGSKGSTNDLRFGMSKNTIVSISGANTKVNGNVYGGGEAGDVGTITRNLTNYNYTWEDSDGGNNTPGNNIIDPDDNKNSGVCTVTITGGTIGDGKTSTKGNVFGAGKGVANTFWCEKAMVFATSVSISGATTVNGNVYGGGEVGRVEDDTKVIIDTSGGSDEPDIKGSVYGAGAGLETHGYSALVRGNSIVTIQGNTKVGGSVFGGGETASLGKFKLDDNKLPTEPDGGGSSTVTITDNAKIGLSGTDHDVYGAGQGVMPNWTYAECSENTPYADRIKNSKRMVTYTPYNSETGKGHLSTDEYKKWDYYPYPEDSPDYHKYVWEYYPTEAAYLAYLKTLAIASNPTVTISENATVYGDVYGGGQRGITLGNVAVNISGGTVAQDVYGGGALADTNKGNWDDSQYVEVTGLEEGHTITDLYTRTGSGTTEDPYIYTKTTDAEVDASETYYSKGTWATGKYNANGTTYKTNVTLTDGTIKGNVYGGGLGQIAREASQGEKYTQAEATAYNDEHQLSADDADYKTTDDWRVEPVTRLDAVKAKVYGDVLVKLNEKNGEDGKENTDNCVVQGSIFGCNNQNGSPQSDVTVHVYKTQGWTGHEGTAPGDLDDENATHTYHLKAVYGGGNLSAFYPDLKATRDNAQAYVIIDGCDLTSIQTVYGGGNAASSPATNVTINGTYEIEEVFGGGNGKEDITINGVSMTNPGANVGYEAYPTDYDIPNSSKEVRTAKFSYGSGEASVKIYGGVIHRVFGGSNMKGNVRVSAVTMLQDMEGCDKFQIDEAYGGGKSAPMDANAQLLMACIPGLKQAYGGAEDADIKGGVTLTITNGTFDRVFGGNNKSGTISGPIVVNVEETGCRPVIIGELYGGGNLAGYSIYGYKEVTEGDKKVWKPRTSATDGDAPAGTPYASPIINVRSFTSIGEIYGGGYGGTAVMVGNPTVNVNVAEGKYYNRTQSDLSSTDSDYNEYDENGYKGNPDKLIYDHEVVIPSHKAGTIGVIQNVYGGGNAAKVIGTPNVYIGTRMGEEEYLAVVEVAETVDANDGYFTRSGEGTAASPYVYTAFKGNTVDGTTYYKKYTIKGADIRGNVYGGGNAAEVTGNTNVVIGKEQ